MLSRPFGLSLSTFTTTQHRASRLPVEDENDFEEDFEKTRRTRIADTDKTYCETVELWLDLCGTKLSPAAAKDRLEHDLGCFDFVDRIVIDYDANIDHDYDADADADVIATMSSAAVEDNPISKDDAPTEQQQNQNQKQEQPKNDPPIIVQKDDLTNSDNSILVGIDALLVTLPASGILLDPMPALNAFSNPQVEYDTQSTSNNNHNIPIAACRNGNLNENDENQLDNPKRQSHKFDSIPWVVLRSEPGDPMTRQEGIASLVPLLAGAVGGTCGATSLSSTLGLDTTIRSNSQSTNKSSIGGGVAWACQTKSDILHAGMLVRSLEQVESTQGGILLSASSVSQQITGKTTGSTIASKLKCALLLPFDQDLWQTGLTFFRDDID